MPSPARRSGRWPDPLDTRPLAEHDLLDEAVVREAAREVGLSDAAVSRAVAEWRCGQLAPLPPLPPDRRAGLPATVRAERRLPGEPDVVRMALAGWLRSQWLQCRRVSGDESRWEPRSGPVASARRTFDLRRTLRLAGVSGVRLCVDPAQDGSRVRLVADLGSTRAGLLAGCVAAPAVVTGRCALALAAATGHGLPEAFGALPAAAAAGGTGWFGARALLAPVAPRSTVPTWAAGLLPPSRSRPR